MSSRTGLHPPTPLPNELPVAYADRVGRWYASSISARQKKQWGQYLTPPSVAQFMAQLNSVTTEDKVRVLDPGAGVGILACALCQQWALSSPRPQEIELVVYEIDEALRTGLEACLTYVKRWLQDRGLTLKYTICIDDFVLAHAGLLNETPSLFFNQDSIVRFDVVISNPPYFKLAKADPRARAAAAVVHGQPNIYALFMAISAKLLAQDGVLIFITPRSYAAGLYFRQFRERFFAMVRPTAIHLFGSRRDAFSKDAVLQENVILIGKRCDDWNHESLQESVILSFSEGVRDLSHNRRREVALTEVLNLESRGKVLRIPVNARDDVVSRIVRAWHGNLNAYGLEISTGPVVAFRAVDLIAMHGTVPSAHAPLLWMQNIQPMRVVWPADVRGKGQYMVISRASIPLLLRDKNYVLLRRFSAKEQVRRLTAAPLLSGVLGSPFIGVENHLNYIYRPGGSLTDHEAYGLAAVLNSELLDSYFRISNGNTQVNATELRVLPLPPLDAISEIGQRVMSHPELVTQMDRLINEVLAMDSLSNLA